MVILKSIGVLQLLITERSELVVDLTSFFSFRYTVELLDRRRKVVIDDFIWFLEPRLGYLVALHYISAAFLESGFGRKLPV